MCSILPENLVYYTTSELLCLVDNDKHKQELLKERRRQQVKFNIRRMRLRRQKQELVKEIVQLKEEIIALKRETEILKNSK